MKKARTIQLIVLVGMSVMTLAVKFTLKMIQKQPAKIVLVTLTSLLTIIIFLVSTLYLLKIMTKFDIFLKKQFDYTFPLKRSQYLIIFCAFIII